MTIRRYFELSLFAPLAVPLLLAVAGLGFGSEPGAYEPEIRSFQFGTALLAVPYLGLAWWARRRMRRMGEPEIVKLSLEAPFLFAGVVCVFMSLVVMGNVLIGRASASQVGGMVVGVGMIALAFAVVYVALIVPAVPGGAGAARDGGQGLTRCAARWRTE